MKTTIFLLILLSFTSEVFTQSNFKHERITVFKDGTSFIEKKATISSVNKMIDFEVLPINLEQEPLWGFKRYSVDDERVTLGSLRFEAEKNQIVEVKVNRRDADSIIVESEYSSLHDLLLINKGKKVRITYDDKIKPVEGRIGKVSTYKVFVQNANDFLIISIGNISKLEFLEKPNLIKKTVQHDKKPKISLNLKLEREQKNQKIKMSYLQKGITWLPTYFINLKDSENGNLVLEANLLNDIEDIENAEINFAVGIPTFSFKNVSEPLFSTRSIWQVLRELTSQQVQDFSQTIQGNIMTQQASIGYRNKSSEYMPEPEGVGNEDLFFYKKKNVNLKKYGRMKIRLLSMKFNYQDVYSCELEKNTARRNYGNEAKSNLVWHSIRFKNTSGNPFTTGTVFFKKYNGDEMSLISQNQLNYTPDKEFVTAKMTVAPDILITSNDIETNRKQVGHDYLLDVSGEINIINYKAYPVELIIDRKVVGNLLDSDKKWEVQSRLEAFDAKNKTNQVSWKLKVGAGKTEKIKYQYKILVD